MEESNSKEKSLIEIWNLTAGEYNPFILKPKTDLNDKPVQMIELQDCVSQHADLKIKNKKDKEDKQTSMHTIWNTSSQGIPVYTIGVLNISRESKSTSFSALVNQAKNVDVGLFEFSMGSKFKILDIKHCSRVIKLNIQNITYRINLSSSHYYDGFVLLFDLSDCNLLEELKKKMKYFNKNFNKCPVLIVGNAGSEKKNIILDRNFTDLFNKNNCAGYIPISTEDSVMCKAVFESLGGIIYDNKEAGNKKVLEIRNNEFTL